MYRAQVLLENWHQQYLKAIAFKEQKSVSEILRDWITEKLKKKSSSKKDPLFSACGALKGIAKLPLDHNNLDKNIYKKDW